MDMVQVCSDNQDSWCMFSMLLITPRHGPSINVVTISGPLVASITAL